MEPTGVHVDEEARTVCIEFIGEHGPGAFIVQAINEAAMSALFQMGHRRNLMLIVRPDEGEQEVAMINADVKAMISEMRGMLNY